MTTDVWLHEDFVVVEGDALKVGGTVNFALNQSDYTHEKCQAVIPRVLST